QQAVPVLTAGPRPVGGVQQQVGVARVSAPDREPQVVADQRTNPPALEFELHLPLARTVMLMLTRHAEEMALVVVQKLAVRSRPQQTIAMAAIRRPHNHAAGHNRVDALGLRQQPFGRHAVLGFGECFGLHGEAGGEHLRQDHQIGTLSLVEQIFEVRVVGFAVVPDQGGLYQGDVQVRQIAQIAHNFSAA
nr:hypothetical protein [Tanacetum cinerariifolium]